jgi:hypothetical protein
MRICVVLAITFIGVLLWGRPAEANRGSDYPCKVHKMMSGELPESARSLFLRGAMMRVCNLGGQVYYYAMWRPWKGRFEVCHFVEQRLFPILSIDQTVVLTDDAGGSKDVQTHSYMALVSASCPAQDDTIYTLTSSISEGVFIAQLRLLGELRNSEDSFNKTCFLPMMGRNEAAERVRPDYTKLSKFLRPVAPHIRRIEFTGFESPPDQPAQYNLELNDPEDRLKFVSIKSDLTDSGFCIARVDYGIE